MRSWNAWFGLILAAIAIGCGPAPGRPGVEQNLWLSSRYSSAEDAWVYRNFYSEFESFDRYIGYGIVHYTRNTKRDSGTSDEVFVQDALRLCRVEFRKAYQDGTLKRWDGRKKRDWPSPYSPKYVAVVVKDWAESADQVGIVVPAKDLFSKMPLEQVMKLGTISRGKLWFEDVTDEERRSGYSPGQAVRYTHVEEHIRSNTNQTDELKPEAR